MPAIGRNTKTAKMQELTPQEIQARWSALLPKVLLWLGFFGAATLGIFIFNHVATPSQKMTDILNVAFQIGCIFVVCFAFLTIAAVFFKSNLWIKKS